MPIVVVVGHCKSTVVPDVNCHSRLVRPSLLLAVKSEQVARVKECVCRLQINGCHAVLGPVGSVVIALLHDYSKPLCMIWKIARCCQSISDI